MNEFLLFAFLFFIGSCLGWCMELLFRRFVSKNNPRRNWINPGFLAGPYLPLYGFGLWGMYEVSHVIKLLVTGNIFIDVFIIFLIMAIIMTIIEFIAGLIFVKGMNVKLWDYSGEKFNIEGVICLKFTVIWGVLGSVYYFTINTRVENWVDWLSAHLTFSFFIGLFFGVFLVDLCYTLQLSVKIRKFAVDNQFIVKYEELKHFISEQRKELKEKGSFILAFKTDKPFKENLERYLERSIETGKKKFEEAKKDMKTKMKSRENKR